MSNKENEPNFPPWSFAHTPESLVDESSPPQPKEPGQSPYNVDNNEPLQNAVDKFKETGDMIHIVKQELRWHLLYKRSKEGKEEIDTEENSPKDYKVSSNVYSGLKLLFFSSHYFPRFIPPSSIYSFIFCQTLVCLNRLLNYASAYFMGLYAPPNFILYFFFFFFVEIKSHCLFASKFVSVRGFSTDY